MLGLWTWRRSPTSASRGFPAGTWPFLCICVPARGYGGFAASAGHSQAGRIKKVELGHTEEVSPRGCEVGLEMSSCDVTGQDQSQGRAGPPHSKSGPRSVSRDASRGRGPGESQSLAALGPALRPGAQGLRPPTSRGLVGLVWDSSCGPGWVLPHPFFLHWPFS